ncbi:acylase [Candidatus Leptofilum sp.]|uniref:acylase n=1 Tax=Candidatus Leptofilum sp. TaxID=3241576 RepID=UPI003B5B5DDA
MRRWQKIALGVVGVLALAAAYIFWPQGVWPFVVNLDELEAVNENYNVIIRRDSFGVPHIFGKTDADAAYGLGYAHAEDDFLTIQQALVAARGRLGMAYGIDAAPNDYMVQLLRIWDVVDAEYDTVPSEIQAIMQGYADGLNYYAALHEDEVMLPEVFPLSGRDVAAGFIHRVPLFFGLDGALGELFAETRQGTISEKEIAQSPISNLQSPVSHLPPAVKYGSNVIAVGPERSANGETFLAINSHQPWEGPVAWYEAHVVSDEGWNTVGGLLPGSPTITHGHNEHLGWAFTVNRPDLIDIYVLEINPDNPDQYLFDGEWRDLEVGEAPITVTLFGRFRWTVKQEVLWSVYGPTVRQEHGVYAIRYAGMGEIGHVEQFVRLNKATNLEEWRAAMREGPLPMFNVGYADAEGNIFYVYNGRIPIRAEGYNWQQYLPGNTSETLWTEYLPFDDLPQVSNPPSGFVQNSNSNPYRTTLGAGNPDEADYSVTLGIDDTMSNRSLRSLALVGGDESITEADFFAYKYDMTYHPESDMARMVNTILAGSPPDDPNERTAYDLLASWDWQTAPDSTGATVAILTLYYLLEADGTEMSVSNMTGGLFTAVSAQSSFSQAVTHLMEHFGTVEVPWQEVNRLVRGDTNLGLGGAPDVLHAVYGDMGEDSRFHGIAGDSYILLVTWQPDGSVSSQSIHQYGSATQDETSPHFADQAPIFVARELTPVWFIEAEILANLEQEYRPGEEND